MRRTSCIVALASITGCSALAPQAPVAQPTPIAPPVLLAGGRLPADVKPVAYTVEIEIVPSQPTFRGRVQIAVDLAVPAREILLHGKGLSVRSASFVRGQDEVAASYEQVDEHGLARLTLARDVTAGAGLLVLEYDAPFDVQLTGLYRVTTAGESYAFTQFEPTSARQAFPCFDEPRFKTPFEVWLTVQSDHNAIANTREQSADVTPDGKKRLRFAPTPPLPTYLVAFAVGPLDIVEAPPIVENEVRSSPLPLRGVAVKGQGPRLAYALEHTPPFVHSLERYLGVPFPYPKLDLIAVPDFAAGAMENAGAITFRDWLLLLDENDAPEHQRRAYAQVNAHELAHHWFGNLVTMPYWDDIWLNEAFATFIGHMMVSKVRPEDRSEIDMLSAVISAMHADSRVSARRIREPVESPHDIVNAFDRITYNKGAGVLGMFERYLGQATFQEALRTHLRAHEHGVASAEDLMGALSTASGQDVASAMGTFLSQVGVPLIEAEVRCRQGGRAASTAVTPAAAAAPDAGAPASASPSAPPPPAELLLKQSRYLPIGSQGDRNVLWQVPVCARYQTGRTVRESCTLLREAQGSIPLDGCPTWVLPNAEAAGYYRFSLARADLEQLERRGLSKLSASERLAFADSMQAAFASGALDVKGMLGVLGALANDEERAVATSAMSSLRFLKDHVLSQAEHPAFERYARNLYAGRLRKLGMNARRGEGGDSRLLRSDLAWFLADVARDPTTRRQLAGAGRAELETGTKQVAEELRAAALAVAMEEGDGALFDAAYQKLVASQDPAERSRLLSALSSVADVRSGRALELTFDPALRTSEVLAPLRAQLRDVRTRDAAWTFFEQRYDALLERLGKRRLGSTPGLAASFCSTEMASRARAFFEPKIAALVGGPRSLSEALEALALCAASANHHREAARAFFKR